MGERDTGKLEQTIQSVGVVERDLLRNQSKITTVEKEINSLALRLDIVTSAKIPELLNAQTTSIMKIKQFFSDRDSKKEDEMLFLRANVD